MDHYGATTEKSLTPRQALALPHLVVAPSVTAGAKRAQIGRSTLRRWMNDPHFRSELQRMRDEAANLAHAKLQGLMLKSVMVIAETLDDPDAVLRLRAARTALQGALASEEHRDLQRRLDLLDDSIARLKQLL